MSVVAKFAVTKVESQSYNQNPLRVEMRTVVLNPVYSSDPASENHTFWNATPVGEIRLGTINQAAWEAFELGREYYVTFERAGGK